jgi:hypothetical protein
LQYRPEEKSVNVGEEFEYCDMYCNTSRAEEEVTIIVENGEMEEKS